MTPLRPITDRPLHRAEHNSDSELPVRYQSQGRLLVVAQDATVGQIIARLRGRLALTVLAPEQAGTLDLPADVPVVLGRPVAISGHLGHFRVVIASMRGQRELYPVTDQPDLSFDLVLDLCEPPTLDAELPPFGYYAPGKRGAHLAQALEELPALVGSFAKPKFFVYDPSLCAHSRKGLPGCTRCLDACPTLAITTLGDGVAVDPYLCQGAGACSAVCPSGAIQYAAPRPEQILAQLRERLANFSEKGGSGACVLVHEPGQGPVLETAADLIPERALVLEVPELAAAGLEIWLAALAYGATEIALIIPPDILPSTEQAIGEQVETAGRVLQGLGYERERIRTFPARSGTLPALAQKSPYETVPPARFAPLNEKRTTLWLAIDHLHDQSSAASEHKALPAGAPMGEVRVDPSSCTLCMGCTTVCPKSALRRGEDDTPQLRFIESLCVQCGLCARACPEDAIRLRPRCVYDRETRDCSRVLVTDQPFHCVNCGRAYSTQRVIERMTEQLKTHPMFQGEGLKRLQMCEHCRAVAVISEDTEVVVHGFTPPPD